MDLGGVGTVLYLDCGGGYMTTHVSKLAELYTKMCEFTACKLYFNIKYFFN